MSTRSNIIALTKGGKYYQRIYCHNDGYLTHNGKILLEHYQDQDKIDQLMALRDISVLGEEIGEKHDFEWYSILYEKYITPIRGSEEQKLQKAYAKAYKALHSDPDYLKYSRWCKAYKRDRAETGIRPILAKPENLNNLFKEPEEFVYFWDGKQWFYADHPKDDEGKYTLLKLTKKVIRAEEKKMKG